jgi:hypothetical protein
MMTDDFLTGAAGVVHARDDERGRALLRLFVVAAVGVATIIFAALHSGLVGAAAPTYQAPTTYPAPATYATMPTAYSAAPTMSASGYPPNTVISTYFDPRYGLVSVITDASGNLIDVNATTGQRIFPLYPDYNYLPGYATPYISPYIRPYYAPSYVAPRYAAAPYRVAVVYPHR